MPPILYKNVQSSKKDIFIFPHSYSSVYSADIMHQDFRGVTPEGFRMSEMFRAVLQNPLKFLSSEGGVRILFPLGGGYRK